MSIDKQYMLPIGTILHDTYRVEEYLSSGGFGNTYVVTNVQFDEPYALKEFFMKGVSQRDGQTSVSVSNKENEAQFDAQREKFKKEARRLRKLQNQHIVHVYDLFEENNTAYYVMDLLSGESLSARMKRMGQPLLEQEVSGLLPQVLCALKTVHSQQIWHLDLKPGNIMTDVNGRVVLIDFGASKQMDASQGYTGTSSALCYTPGFAPSEQIDGNFKRIGPWTDFYALGATLYNLLTSQQPPSTTDVMLEGERCFYYPAGVSSRMRELVIWLMQPRYDKRPQSVDEIEAWLGSSSVTVEPNEEIVTVQEPKPAIEPSVGITEETTVAQESDSNSTLLSAKENEKTSKICDMPISDEDEPIPSIVKWLIALMLFLLLFFTVISWFY